MDPSFKTIADLFQVQTTDAGAVLDNPRRAHGSTADESDELGRQCLTDGDYETAIRHFREAVARREPGDVISRIHLGGAYEATDQYPQALREYEKALKANKDVTEPIVGISDLYKRYGRFRDAIEKLEKATELEPANPFCQFQARRGRFEDAGEPFASHFGRPADDGEARRVLLPLLDRRSDDPAGPVRRCSRRSLRAAHHELSPRDDFLYLRAAVAFWGAGRQIEAIKSVRLASDLDPSKNMYHGLLGILLEESGQIEEAHLESDRASKMDRYDHDMLSRLLDEMGIEP